MGTWARMHHTRPTMTQACSGVAHHTALYAAALLQRIRPDSIRVANAERWREGGGGGSGRAEYRNRSSLLLESSGAGRLARGLMLDSRTAHPRDDEGTTKNCVQKKNTCCGRKWGLEQCRYVAQDDIPVGESWHARHFGRRLTAEALCTRRQPACEACGGMSGDGGGTPVDGRCSVVRRLLGPGCEGGSGVAAGPADSRGLPTALATWAGGGRMPGKVSRVDWGARCTLRHAVQGVPALQRKCRRPR